MWTGLRLRSWLTNGTARLIARGEKNRIVASTRMNETSSRSHSLLQLIVTQRQPTGSTIVGQLNLADLAGTM